MKVLKLEKYIEPIKTPPVTPPAPIAYPTYEDNYNFYNYPNTLMEDNPWLAEQVRIEQLKQQYMLNYTYFMSDNQFVKLDISLDTSVG